MQNSESTLRQEIGHADDDERLNSACESSTAADKDASVSKYRHENR